MNTMKRRTFMKSAATVSAFTILKPDIVFGARNNSTVRMGFIGCGNRGTGVIKSMSAGSKVNIIALADIFDDKLVAARKTLNESNLSNGFAEIGAGNIHRGSEAWLSLLDNESVDAVLISTPAYAHPEILDAAVSAGKHVYCEKPAAIDTDGCKRILRVSETINNRLSAVIGFQIRYATPYVEMVRRIHRGDIGEIVSGQLYYFSSGAAIHSHPGVSHDEQRIRNHFHFNELSGGILLDQGIHMIDVCNWALNSRPVHAYGDGNRKGRGGIGNCWTNYQVIYGYPGEINVTVQSTQVGPKFGDVCARFIGTKGIAEAHYSGGVFIQGENEWDSGVLRSGNSLTPQQIAAGVARSSLDDADRNKGASFINSIEQGQYLNQLRSGCESTLSAILGREAATRRELVTWDEIDLLSHKIDPMLDLRQFDK
jgi:myo-inositol 2-dehydrogenase / D-chiro-inositol 1-dehydrogenase